MNRYIQELVGADSNPTYLGKWPEKLGGFILNFANLEFLTYQYLNRLEVTEEDFLKNTDKLLVVRIDRITSLIEALSKISDEIKKEILELWGIVRDLAKWRNRIAHNPILPTWKPGSDHNTSPPDVIGIPDMKQITLRNTISDSLSMEAMDALIDDTHNLASRLIALLQYVQR